MQRINLVLVLLLSFYFCSCRSDFETVASSGELAFSKDTLYLDTIFTNLSSRTYSLKVYNHSKNDITIPIIKFAKGLASNYRMSVDGTQGNQGRIFENITLLAKDSLYIFVETTIKSDGSAPDEFLYTDQIEFDSGARLQKIELVSLVKDAILLHPQKNADLPWESPPYEDRKIAAFYLDKSHPIHGNELIFNNKKAYVIYGYAVVPEGETVLFEPGARVYFHTNSGLIVPKNASLQIRGTKSTTAQMENEVVFSGDRLQADYHSLPGQWGSIWLQRGSTQNSIQNLSLTNASVGLLIEGNDTKATQLKNCQIYNCLYYGIQTENAIIEAENLVINNVGFSSLGCFMGGNYKFTHSTFNNNWPSSWNRAVTLSNMSQNSQTVVQDLTAASFNNCILYGSTPDALLLENNSAAAFVYQFNNCLIRSAQNNKPDYRFETDPLHYNGIVLNKDPNFLNPNLNNFRIDNSSAAFAKGSNAYLVPLDILGNSRSLPPDLGAYQSSPFTK